MRGVRGDDAPQGLRGGARVAQHLQSPEVLQSALHGHGAPEGDTEARNLPLASQADARPEVRGVRDTEEAPGAPLRWESDEQLAGEHSDIVYPLSSGVALCADEHRTTDCGPDAVLVGDAVNRTHRLKALGNGIVPAVAYIFAAAIADVLEFA